MMGNCDPWEALSTKTLKDDVPLRKAFFWSGHNLLDFGTVEVSLRSSKFFAMPCKGAQLGKNFGNPTRHNHPRFTNSTL